MSNYIIVNGNLRRYNDELYHFGVKGMKWGVRRYQNKNGALASQGKKRYSEDDGLKTKKRGLTDRQKKVIKVGASVAVGAVVAAYGAYKIHETVRHKNFDIRMNEGKAKCERMFKKLDRMKINDLVNGSSGTEKWTNPRSYKRSGFQYNNNGKTVTLAREYRNTVSTIKPEQYRRVESKLTDKIMDDAFNQAKNDSFATATKNVVRDMYRNRKKR